MTTALSAQNTRLAQQEQALADRLAATQEALAAAVAAQNDRLGRVLSESAVKAEETAGKIHERLAVIDAARANMEALGAQVGSLAQILGNKQARGAFGEVQLRQLIEDRLPRTRALLAAGLVDWPKVAARYAAAKAGTLTV